MENTNTNTNTNKLRSYSSLSSLRTINSNNSNSNSNSNSKHQSISSSTSPPPSIPSRPSTVSSMNNISINPIQSQQQQLSNNNTQPQPHPHQQLQTSSRPLRPPPPPPPSSHHRNSLSKTLNQIPSIIPDSDNQPDSSNQSHPPPPPRKSSIHVAHHVLRLNNQSHQPNPPPPPPPPRRTSISLSPNPNRSRSTPLGPPPPPPPRPLSHPRTQNSYFNPTIDQPTSPTSLPPSPIHPPPPPPPPPPLKPKPRLTSNIPSASPCNDHLSTSSSSVPPPPLPNRSSVHPIGPRDWSHHRQSSPNIPRDHPHQNPPSSLPPSNRPELLPPPTRNFNTLPTPSILRNNSIRRNVVYDSDEEEDEQEQEQYNDNEEEGNELSVNRLKKISSIPNLNLQPSQPNLRMINNQLPRSAQLSGTSNQPNGFDTAPTRADEIPDSTFANRRPPFLNPRINIQIGSQFNAWSLRGKYLCTGHHQLRLLNVLTGEVISHVNSLQDIKITSMEFKASSPLPPTSQTLNNPVTTNRPIIHPNTDRYVWCGTKDGQLFEFDCWERRVTDSKSSLHSSAVIGVYRCKSGGMCTLDDSSKVQIWSSPGQIRISSPARAQRIIDKINFSEMISHQLWVSSGPSSSKSSSNASQRSPTIRVYDPDPSQAWTVTPRALKVPDSMGTALGQVMAGTVIPSKPNRVYLGHDTGHVSVWLTNQTPSISSTTSNLAPSSSGLTRRPSIAINKNLNSGSIAFKRLLKLSNYQITAMVGVTKYLWVGFKTGNVYVYETDDGETQRNEAEEVEGYSRRNSWKVLKVWRAHKESILKIFVDPSGLWDEEVGKLHVATTSTDWKVKLWDGTMSVDWLSTEMKRREPEYCTYRTIKTLICSWNVDACKPQELVGTKDNLNFLEDVLKSGCNGGDTSTRPDVLVFGFQEMIDLENKKLTAKTVLLGSRKKGVEKLPDSVSLTYRKWHDRLVSAVRMTMPVDDPYVVIHTENLVGLFTCVFVKSSERDKMRDIAITTVKTGMKGRYGNKGAILARFVVDDSSVCFINCHLAAGQKNVRQRNEDLIDILEEKSGFPDPTIEMNATTGVFVGGGNGSSILDHEICFLQGDLNYRIDCRREDVIRAISAGESFKLLEFDQLIKEKLNNPSFRLRSFYEPPIRFHPTYKYDRGTHMYDSSEKNRTPAWCDRILYRTPQESLKSNYELVNSNNNGVGGFSINGTTVETLDYRRYEVNVSDHRPISGTYLLRVKSIVPGLRRKVWEEVKARWNDYESEVIANAKGYYRNF